MKRLAAVVIAIAALSTACAGNVFSLEVGQCFNEPDDTAEVSSVEVVDCSETHDNEIYATFDLPGEDYPGDTVAGQLSGEGCAERFEGYVGRDYQSSIWFSAQLRPTQESWDRQDDREVVCYLFLQGEQTTGSAKNGGL